MPDPELHEPSPPLRLAAASAARPEPPQLPPPLVALRDALAPLGLDPFPASQALLQRLGDARTVGLLGHGETAHAAGKLLARALEAGAPRFAKSVAERADDSAGRLAIVRATGALRFGELLVAQGVVAPRRLEAALEAQKQSGRRIGEELVAQGHIAAREVAEALWLQHKLNAAAAALGAIVGAMAADPKLRLVQRKS
jgi:hypothetical protein